MNDCIFCKIVNKKISAKIIYEDDELIAFPDMNPSAKVHILLIPKIHINSLKELSERDHKLAGNLLLTANKIAKKMNIDQTGYRVVTNVGKDAGQVICHLHFHILGGEALGPIG